jgi:hypothetical protein
MIQEQVKRSLLLRRKCLLIVHGGIINKSLKQAGLFFQIPSYYRKQQTEEKSLLLFPSNKKLDLTSFSLQYFLNVKYGDVIGDV